MKNTEIGNETANINMKKATIYPQCQRRRINNNKNHKMILLSITLTFRRCNGGQYHLFMIFVVFDLSPFPLWINCFKKIFMSTVWVSNNAVVPLDKLYCRRNFWYEKWGYQARGAKDRDAEGVHRSREWGGDTLPSRLCSSGRIIS